MIILERLGFAVACVCLLVGCRETTQRDETINLKPNDKLISAIVTGESVSYLTQPMGASDIPVVKKLYYGSTSIFGDHAGVVTFVESKTVENRP